MVRPVSPSVYARCATSIGKIHTLSRLACLAAVDPAACFAQPYLLRQSLTMNRNLACLFARLRFLGLHLFASMPVYLNQSCLVAGFQKSLHTCYNLAPSSMTVGFVTYGWPAKFVNDVCDTHVPLMCRRNSNLLTFALASCVPSCRWGCWGLTHEAPQTRAATHRRRRRGDITRSVAHWKLRSLFFRQLEAPDCNFHECFYFSVCRCMHIRYLFRVCFLDLSHLCSSGYCFLRWTYLCCNVARH
jgi:hypothetical protein